MTFQELFNDQIFREPGKSGQFIFVENSKISKKLKVSDGKKPEGGLQFGSTSGQLFGESGQSTMMPPVCTYMIPEF